MAKVIAWGETRGEALLRMRRALAEYKIMGLKTNLPFHQKLIDSTRFLAGRYDTQFVEEYLPMHDESQDSEDEEVAAILATVVEHLYRQQASQIVARPKRDASNWKWIGRYERMHR